jgi:hydrogenase nickel incorporation protein HypA/HybF
MHELSIAQSLVELVEDELLARQGSDDAPPCVGRITVKIGALSGVVPEALSSAFPVAAARSTLGPAALVIDFQPVVAYCPSCGADRELPSPQRLRCPACGTPTPDIVAGRELELVSIEVLSSPASLKSARRSSRRTTSPRGRCAIASTPPASSSPAWSPAPARARQRSSARCSNG